eukprot:3011020-Rhodomonas_salina.2
MLPPRTGVASRVRAKGIKIERDVDDMCVEDEQLLMAEAVLDEYASAKRMHGETVRADPVCVSASAHLRPLALTACDVHGR